MVSQVSELRVYCCYVNFITSPSGSEVSLDPKACQSIVTLGSKADHEASCSFSPQPCPLSTLCGRIPTHLLDDHVDTCPYHTCENAHLGCTVTGTKQTMINHVKVLASILMKLQVEHILDFITGLTLALSLALSLSLSLSRSLSPSLSPLSLLH